MVHVLSIESRDVQEGIPFSQVCFDSYCNTYLLPLLSLLLLLLLLLCESLTKMLKDLDIEVPIQRRLLWKVMNIAIRSTYYIFCRRNKDWTDPDLMGF